MLGADEVNGSVGRLVQNRFCEYLPLLGGLVVEVSDHLGRPPPPPLRLGRESGRNHNWYHGQSRHHTVSRISGRLVELRERRGHDYLDRCDRVSCETEPTINP